MNAVICRADGSREKIDLPEDSGPQLRAMQEAVGGYIEAVYLPTDPQMVVWANEEGLLLGLPVNRFASMICIAMGNVIVGDVLITGGADADGNTLPLDDRWVQELTEGIST